jgi:hypothetical protein
MVHEHLFNDVLEADDAVSHATPEGLSLEKPISRKDAKAQRRQE